MTSDTSFNKLRGFFWPIHRHECKKLLPMMLMLFLICFNHSVLRNVKDAVVITAKASGAEVIPFIKVWVLLPMAVLFTLIFTKLSNRFSQEKVFYIVITFYLSFFAIFTFLFYPLRDWLHPHAFADYLTNVLPAGFKGLIAMFRNWTYTLFYVICELWGSIVLNVLFWSFANEITKITEARRFYSMMGVASSIAAILAGIIANLVTDDQSWENTLQTLTLIILGSGSIVMLAFRWMNQNVLTDPSFHEFHETKKQQKKSKKKLSIWESFSYLSNSSYLICIAVLVVAYNLTINMVEIVWKDQLRQLYSSTVEYSRYMNSIIATITAVFMAQLIARFGWTKTALITPVIMLLTSVGFFGFMLFREELSAPVYLLTGTTPLAIAVFFGAAQVCLSKACKFSVFDSTKEMAFIPLGHECKLKGKAAIDGVGSRLGKSGGSFIHQGLLMFFATLSSSAPYVAAILVLVIIGWMVAVRALGIKFAALAGKEGREEIGSSSHLKEETSSRLSPPDPHLQTSNS